MFVFQVKSSADCRILFCYLKSRLLVLSDIFFYGWHADLGIYLPQTIIPAVFDIQNGSEKIIDIALKYGYESPTAFTRAFKELHGTTPMSARRQGVVLKNYPPISFVLSIKEVEQMKFRMEKRECFQIIGLSGYDSCKCPPGDSLSPLWRKFMDNYNEILWNNGESFYTAPFWQVAAYQFESQNGLTKTIIGGEAKDKVPAGLTIETIPAADWAVFMINSKT